MTLMPTNCWKTDSSRPIQTMAAIRPVVVDFKSFQETPKVKVADLKGYLQEQKTLLAAGTITEDQWKRNLDTLEQVFREQPSRQLIILKDVVLHHDPDTEIKLK